MALSDKKNKSKLSRRAALAKWLYGDRAVLHNRLYYGGLLLAIALSAAAFLTPGIQAQHYTLTSADIGSPAPTDIKASRPYEIADPDSTERLRREAASAVRAVFVLDRTQGEGTVSRIREGFARMRAVADESRGKDAPNADSTKTVPATPEGEAAASKGHSPTTPEVQGSGGRVRTEEARQEAPVPYTTYQPYREEFSATLQALIGEEDFRTLATTQFARTYEDGLVRLVGEAMKGPIAADPELLALEGSKGITLRIHGTNGWVRENLLEDVTKIPDIEAARDEVARRANVEFEGAPPAVRKLLVGIARRLVRPTLSYDPAETEGRRTAARDSVKAVVIPVKKGDMIVRDGERITSRHLLILKGMDAEGRSLDRAQVAVGSATIVLILVLVGYFFGQRNIRKFHPSRLDCLFLTSVYVVTIFLTWVAYHVSGALSEKFSSIPLSAFHYAIPVAAAAMLVRFVLNSETALLFGATVALSVGLMMDHLMTYGLFAFLSTLVAVGSVAQVSQRSTLLRAGLLTGLANMVSIICLAMLAGKLTLATVVWEAVFGVIGGVSAAMMVTALTPAVEVLFGYTTDIKLLELANLNHPLLKELVVQAPGTYHHSIIIGTLVEAAAEAIGANPLLARVASYYHDIGKTRNPLYFSENQRSGENRHDRLQPSMSALIIKAHVKDGIEMARNFRLGKPVQDIIPQHHGTSLISYFYLKAKDQESTETGPVLESDYRYPGPRPQSREAALVMLADAVEAASRTLADPSPARLQGMVQKIINRIFKDGQLDECDLTLKDLHEIAKSFTRTLSGIYHQRVQYQMPASKGREEPRQRSNGNHQQDGADRRQHRSAESSGRPHLRPVDKDEEDEDLKRLGMS